MNETHFAAGVEFIVENGGGAGGSGSIGRVANHENDVVWPKCTSSYKTLDSGCFYAKCLSPGDEL